jgi:hypothetical protein
MKKKRASIRQVAATIFFALFAIGKKNTWQKDGATVTLPQIIVGALVGFAVVLAILIALVTVATS